MSNQKIMRLIICKKWEGMVLEMDYLSLPRRILYV